jgi:hypothetical protein
MPNPNFDSSIRGDSNDEVKALFKAATKRKEDAMKYKLLSDLLSGETVDITKSNALYEAINREKMDFEEIMNLHPEEVQECLTYVKERKAEQNGRWYNPESEAWWGEKGAIPPCVYHSRPVQYWKDKRLTNLFFNTYPKFRIAEGKL